MNHIKWLLTFAGIRRELCRNIKNENYMKKYRVSGYMDEVGAVQVDVDALSPEEAIEVASDEYGLEDVVNVSEV